MVDEPKLYREVVWSDGFGGEHEQFCFSKIEAEGDGPSSS